MAGYVLFNAAAGKDNTPESFRVLDVLLQKDLKYIDMREIRNYAVFLSGLQAADTLILCGGDGTLNRFVNDTEGIPCPCEILYFPTGTGNDFAHDLGFEKDCPPFPVKKYLEDLPLVRVHGKTYRFINGVGYGIDGYCCQVGDELRKIPGKKVDYTAIAIKGLLFHYKRTKAAVTVDGVQHTYDKVWLAPTMHGRFYGGGMMPAPNRTRADRDTLSVLVFHGTGKLKTLLIFPSLFKGEHIKHKKYAEILTGRTITVTFDRPTALQIDGETILDVQSYTAFVPGAEPEISSAEYTP